VEEEEEEEEEDGREDTGDACHARDNTRAFTVGSARENSKASSAVLKSLTEPSSQPTARRS
jgi:hypothetical protein